MARVLITTDYLRPGDEVDGYLREHGHETVHLPMLGRRDPEELVAALAGVDAALDRERTDDRGRPARALAPCAPSSAPASATTPSTSPRPPGSGSA